MMFRLRSVSSCLRRLLHSGTANRDQVLERLEVCSIEDQVFDVVGKNKAKLTVEHVGCAVRMLWEFQKEKPQLLRTVDSIKAHPEFLTLRVLAENKIALMDDFMLVDILYAFLRYIKRHIIILITMCLSYNTVTHAVLLPSFRMNVEPHDSLVQQLVSEAWLRLDRYDEVEFIR